MQCSIFSKMHHHMKQRGILCMVHGECIISIKIPLKVKDNVGKLYTVEPPLPMGENEV